MGGFRGGGLGMATMRAERSPHGRNNRAGQADLPKTKPNLRKIWPEVKALVVPRKGLIIGGLVLMVINRACGPGAALHVEAFAGRGAFGAASAS